MKTDPMTGESLPVNQKSPIVTLSFTLAGANIDEMNHCASKIITAAVKVAKRLGLRIHFTREQEEAND